MRALRWSLLLMSLLVMGCASTPVHTDDVTGSVAWHATDLQLAKVTVQGQPGERYTFTLVLSNRGGAGDGTFTDLQRTVSAHQVQTAPTHEWDVGDCCQTVNCGSHPRSRTIVPKRSIPVAAQRSSPCIGISCCAGVMSVANPCRCHRSRRPSHRLGITCTWSADVRALSQRPGIRREQVTLGNGTAGEVNLTGPDAARSCGNRFALTRVIQAQQQLTVTMRKFRCAPTMPAMMCRCLIPRARFGIT